MTISRFLHLGMGGAFAFLAGCVPIPFSDSTALPAIRPFLPEGASFGVGELLVLIHFSEAQTSDWLPSNRPVYGPSATAKVSRNEVVVGRIMKAGDVHTISDQYALRSSSNLGIISIWGWLGDDQRERRMLRLCMLNSRGEQVSLTPTEDKWTLTREPRITMQGRDAVLASLRDNNGSLDTGGPCGMTGRLEWQEGDVSRAMEYLLRLSM